MMAAAVEFSRPMQSTRQRTSLPRHWLTQRWCGGDVADRPVLTACLSSRPFLSIMMRLMTECVTSATLEDRALHHLPVEVVVVVLALLLNVCS